MSNANKTSFSILGAGSWGTALAILLARNGHEVCLWGHNQAHIKTLQQQKVNQQFLPDITFPDTLHPVSDLNDCVERSDNCLIVVPSHAFREVLDQIKPSLHNKPVIWATKGIEPASRKLIHEIVEETLGKKHAMAVMSGPTFALEVAKGLPTALTVASNNPEFAEQLAGWLHSDNFRAYTSDDIIGVEIGGAIKNVLAIAAGIADGLGFGANTRSALITRGLHEIMMLGIALGGKKETFMGLAGLGDLVLTCTDNQSRNRRFGLALAQGKTMQAALDEIKQTVEGIKTTEEALGLAKKFNIEMPITQQVSNVLNNKITAQEAVHLLLGREQKPETR
ncbi:MAG: NAD(P)H-dependent glycerol-3-phosphate dehydrogenase [Gammaproteobacteria bacterium]|nr:NAD(P)H-dependent glycerol-3-phosphate dehydrogenase [Gammaproteobacteria bacterium]